MAELKVRIPDSTRALMERLTKRDGISLNAFAAAAIAEKCAAIESAEAVFRSYAGGTNPDDALALLRTMGRPGQVRQGDKLPVDFPMLNNIRQVVRRPDSPKAEENTASKEQSRTAAPTVRWVKAVDGLGGQDCLNCKLKFQSRMQEMVSELSGTDDLIAFYVASAKCKDKIYRSKICGFAKIPQDAKVTILKRPNYKWNDDGTGQPIWPVQIPLVQPWLGIPLSDIAQINTKLQQITGSALWKSFQSALRGPPVRVNWGKYSVIGDILNDYLATNPSLCALPDLGNHGATPGSHIR